MPLGRWAAGPLGRWAAGPLGHYNRPKRGPMSSAGSGAGTARRQRGAETLQQSSPKPRPRRRTTACSTLHAWLAPSTDQAGATPPTRGRRLPTGRNVPESAAECTPLSSGLHVERRINPSCYHKMRSQSISDGGDVPCAGRRTAPRHRCERRRAVRPSRRGRRPRRQGALQAFHRDGRRIVASRRTPHASISVPCPVRNPPLSQHELDVAGTRRIAPEIL